MKLNIIKSNENKSNQIKLNNVNSNLKQIKLNKIIKFMLTMQTIASMECHAFLFLTRRSCLTSFKFKLSSLKCQIASTLHFKSQILSFKFFLNINYKNINFIVSDPNITYHRV